MKGRLTSAHSKEVELLAAPRAGFLKNAVDVVLHVGGDVKILSDSCVALALKNLYKHLALPRCKRRGFASLQDSKYEFLYRFLGSRKSSLGANLLHANKELAGDETVESARE